MLHILWNAEGTELRVSESAPVTGPGERLDRVEPGGRYLGVPFEEWATRVGTAVDPARLPAAARETPGKSPPCRTGWRPRLRTLALGALLVVIGTPLAVALGLALGTLPDSVQDALWTGARAISYLSLILPLAILWWIRGD